MPIPARMKNFKKNTNNFDITLGPHHKKKSKEKALHKNSNINNTANVFSIIFPLDKIRLLKKIYALIVLEPQHRELTAKDDKISNWN
ncbi:hypothetical protein BpHYR1_014837 [Brachionus plicatilis]|uniref:Uncharacterized protein n=1 Tax=Brachionus plicatilis TaxID=10195 RepID=A0A3M7QJZ2_BRAPC|nr:hypothetical protein BpHYR1_014837 [Brachionus plicatilis]